MNAFVIVDAIGIPFMSPIFFELS